MIINENINLQDMSTLSTINGTKLLRFNIATDPRGDLLAIELDKQIPFPVRRMFYVMNVPAHSIRGEHAHYECHQLLVCLQGSVTVNTDNGTLRKETVLNRPDIGLHLHPLIWASQFHYSSDAVVAVFASHSYDPADYIRDYEEFLKITNS